MAERNRFQEFEQYGNAIDHLDEINAIIEQIPFFAGFNPNDLAGVARHMRCYLAPEGAEIIREGETGEFVLLLLEGKIEILKQNTQGVPQRIGIVSAGETVGEMSLVDGAPRFASCSALEPIKFAVLDRRALDLIFAKEPQLGITILSGLLRLLNQRLRETGKQLVGALMR